ncbi:MAG: hypothetical protein AAFV54_11160, partial [Pseudomonadota bacterium]
ILRSEVFKHAIRLGLKFLGGVGAAAIIAGSALAQFETIDCGTVPETSTARCESYNEAADQLRRDCAGENGSLPQSTCPVRKPMMQDAYNSIIALSRGTSTQSTIQTQAIPNDQEARVSDSSSAQAPSEASIGISAAPPPVTTSTISDQLTIFGLQLGKTYEEQGINECRRSEREIIVYPPQTAAQRREYERTPRWLRPDLHKKLIRFCGYELSSGIDEASTCWQRTRPERFSDDGGRHKHCSFADLQGNFIPEQPNISGRYFNRRLYYVGPSFARFIPESDRRSGKQGRNVDFFFLDEQRRLAGMSTRTFSNLADEARTTLINKYGKPTRIERDAYLLESGSQITLDKYVWEKPNIYVEFNPISPSTFTKYQSIEVLSGSRIDRLLGIPAISRVPAGTATDFQYGSLRIMLPHIKRDLDTDTTIRQGL